MNTTFEDLRNRVVRFRDARDWRQFHTPRNLAQALSVEVGELQELFLWKTTEEVEEALSDSDFRRRLADELADVQTFLLYLAERTDISLPEAVKAKLRLNEERYPVEKSRGSSRKYTEFS